MANKKLLSIVNVMMTTKFRPSEADVRKPVECLPGLRKHILDV